MSSLQDVELRDQQGTERVHPFRVPMAEATLRLRPTGRTFPGSLNRNVQLTDQTGRLYLLRMPQKERRHIYEHIAITYRAEGFTAPTSTYRYRTIAEQARFMHHVAHEGIRVLHPLAIAHDTSSLLVPFLQAESLDAYLQHGETEAVGAVLANLTHAHHKGIVLGDRWVCNTLIMPQGIIEVDFDIVLEGPQAKEFELGKLFYHLLFYASDREQMLTYLEGYVNKERATFAKEYDLAKVQFFIRTHTEVFGASTTVVIDPIHQSTIPPVSREHADQLLSILQAVQ
jgi:tRNA A-37 threonylcarbamoyl transferase component Bud32